MAKIVGEVAGTSGMYGGDQTKNQGKLLGLTQIAGRVADPAEAATAVRKFAADMTEAGNQKVTYKNKDKHLDTLDAQGRLKDPAEILEQLFAKSGGKNLHSFGLGERSIKLAQALLPTYDAAEAKQKGSGAKAVGDEVRAYETLSASAENANKDFELVMRTNGERIDQAFNHLKEVIADKAAPFLERFVNKLPELVPKVEKFIDIVGRLADWFTDNPFKGIGAIVLASIAKDLAAAAVGEGVKRAVMAAVGGVGAGGPGVGGGLGGIGGVGAAGPLAAAGALTIGAAYGTVTSALEGQKSGQYMAGQLAATDTTNAKDVAGANAMIKDANSATSVEGLLKLVASAYTYVGDKVYQQLPGENEKSSLIGDGGGSFGDRMKKLFASFEVVDVPLKGFVGAMNDATAAAKTFSKSATAPGAPQRNVPIDQRH
jgi:hypothetical protein